MSDIFGKIESVAGLALLGGLAYVALRFGPGILASFKQAGEQAGETMGSVLDTAVDIVPGASIPAAESVPDMITIINTPGATGADVAGASSAAAWDIVGLMSPSVYPLTNLAKSITSKVFGGFADAPAPEASSASAVSFVSGQASDINFDANLAKKQAEWQAAQDARTEAVKLLVQERNAALAAEREAQRIQTEQQYNAWLQSTKPASSVSNFLNVGKQYQGQQEVAPGVYVAPSGAYQVIQGGQIVAAGSAGAVQGALVAANADMYPGTNYRREVVEGYQAKARAGDAAAAAWLKRFAPAGAV